ncbi:MAG: hypothetical protein ACK5QX_01105 [bacterium]
MANVTAIELIESAMRLDGVYALGEPITDDEANTGLSVLNDLVDALGTANLLIYAPTLDVVPLVANQASYSIGPTGTSLVTASPTEVLESSTITYQGVDYPLSKWTLQDYNSITIKNIGGTPGVIYPQMSFPNIQVFLWPVPVAGMSLNLWTNKAIASFPDLTTTVSLPAGWKKMLRYLLAEDLAPEFDVPVPPEVIKQAAIIRKNIKRTNQSIPLMQMPYGIPATNTWVDWRGN